MSCDAQNYTQNLPGKRRQINETLEPSAWTIRRKQAMQNVGQPANGLKAKSVKYFQQMQLVR